LIADKVKRMSEKKTPKQSLIYNLNNNYKNYQEQNFPKKNFKEKLKDILLSRKDDNDNCLFDLEEVKKEDNDEGLCFDLPVLGKLERNHHSTEEVISESNELKKIIYRKHDNEMNPMSARKREKQKRSRSLNTIQIDKDNLEQLRHESD